ncbi:hypothetical protein [Anaerostipes butyraticus]|uniref:Uncharacterized protein n=1 Tax=Anaerostipes butyraticus TaxID=645466 RepID=A0A916QCU8_9FIRM|nr:hypothetical protein [Anaerostipes butyraticus]GFO86786.1 hypothetical protein ANBU17_31330 [Anaerostipes butyraticus]HJC83149.1 hypothetical protein [Candidatus Anaerostipes avicola]
MTNHDELSYYLSRGLAVRVDGVTINSRNLEHVDLILKEDDSYMKEFIENREGEIFAVDYQKIRE